jgi:hypothetical protein
VVLVEGNRDRSHHSGMLTSEDHRQLAERCIRLAKRKFKDVAAVTRYRHLFCAAFSLDFTLQLPESHTRTICMCSDRASLNSTSSMIDGSRRASESRAAYSRCLSGYRKERACRARTRTRTSLFGTLPSSRWCRPTHFNGAVTIMVFQMSSGLTCRAHEEGLRYGHSAS